MGSAGGSLKQLLVRHPGAQIGPRVCLALTVRGTVLGQVEPFSMNIRPADTDEETYRVWLQVLRSLSPGQRLENTLRLSEQNRELALAGIVLRHPGNCSIRDGASPRHPGHFAGLRNRLHGGRLRLQQPAGI